MVIEYINTMNEKGTINIPFSLRELTFSNFIDFKAVEQSYMHEHVKAALAEAKLNDEELKKEDIKPPALSIMLMTEAVAAITGAGIHDFDTVLSEKDLQKLFDDNFMLTMQDFGLTDLTVQHLYVHILTLINSYKPEQLSSDYRISIGGKLYCIQGDAAARALTGIRYTAGEVVTLKNFQRTTALALERAGGYDAEGNLGFNLGLEEVATLLRPVGVKLPWERRERIAFIDSQKELFKDLPLDVIMNIRFFLLNSIKELAKTLAISFSSTPVKGRLQAGVRRRKGTRIKRTKKSVS